MSRFCWLWRFLRMKDWTRGGVAGWPGFEAKGSRRRTPPDVFPVATERRAHHVGLSNQKAHELPRFGWHRPGGLPFRTSLQDRASEGDPIAAELTTP
jgi:hypothetical protein